MGTYARMHYASLNISFISNQIDPFIPWICFKDYEVEWHNLIYPLYLPKISFHPLIPGYRVKDLSQRIIEVLYV